jgi:glutamine synthetase
MMYDTRANEGEWEEFLRGHPETRFVDTFMIGISGQTFGKRESAKDLDRIFRSGVTFSACAALLDVHGHGHDAAGLGATDGDPDAVGFPVAGSLVPVPWTNAPTAQLLLDMRDVEHGEKLWFDPRKILADIVKAMQADGFYPTVACELEFYLIDSERAPDGGLKLSKLNRTKAAPNVPSNLGLERVEDYSDFVIAIERAAALQNLPATTAVAEYGLGQFEINLHHVNDPLLASDQAILLKRLIRGVARAQGHDATFMAKPFIDQPGNGLHIHVSLCDKDGNNLFGAAGGDALLHQAIAGLQMTMAESLGFYAPNFSSFRRYTPRNFVPINAHWGENNRSVALRVPYSDAKARRIEHRAACADASPHLVMASILAGIHHGLKAKLKPSAPINLTRADEIDPPDHAPLMARHYLGALDQLEHAEILARFMPAKFLKAYCETKYGEYEELFASPLPREYDFYL